MNYPVINLLPLSNAIIEAAKEELSCCGSWRDNSLCTSMLLNSTEFAYTQSKEHQQVLVDLILDDSDVEEFSISRHIAGSLEYYIKFF